MIDVFQEAQQTGDVPPGTQLNRQKNRKSADIKQRLILMSG